MKLLNAIAAVAVVSTSLIAANPAEAGGWCGSNRHGADLCITTYGNRKGEITLDDKFNGTGYIMFVDCKSGNWRVRANTGYSRSDINHEARKACTLI